MTHRWQRAMRAAEERLDWSAGESVSRVEVAKDGALVLTAEGEDERRWFRYEDDALEELRPEGDAALSLAARLPALRDRGARLLAWRPGRRMVVGWHGAPQGPAILKCYRRRRAEEARQRHEAAWRAGDAAGFRIPGSRPHEFGEEVLGLEWLEGATLDPGGDPVIWSEAGRCLRRFQKAPLGELRLHGRADECAVLDRLAQRVAEAVGALPQGWTEVRARLGSAPAPAEAAVPVHRDLHDGQLLRCADRIALLDLDLLCGGEPTVDAANLSVELRLRGMQSAAHSCEEARAAFLAGFGEGDDGDGGDGGDGGDAAWAAGFHFHEASTALRLALVYRMRPRWTSLIPELVAMARRAWERADEARHRNAFDPLKT